MFRATRQSASERKRIGTIGKILLLFPLCFVLSAGWVVVTQLTSGASASGPTRAYSARLGLVIAHLDEPVSEWDVRPYFFAEPSASQVFVHVDVISRSRWRDLLSEQPTIERTIELSVLQISGNGNTITQRVQSAFNREFGSDWNRITHPALISRVVPVIEAEALDEFAPWQSVTPAQIASGLSSTSPLVIEWTELGQPIKWSWVTVVWAVLLWLVLSAVVVVHATLSKEMKARRWVAMKCPKCGYERQRDRGECPECGLVYERPSYVMWDPTEEGAGERREQA